MPITTSAKKALRASRRKRIFNLRRSRAMRELIKNVRVLSAQKKSSEAAALLSQVYQAVDKAAKRGVIKKNAAARKKSRLAKAAHKVSARS